MSVNDVSKKRKVIFTDKFFYDLVQTYHIWDIYGNYNFGCCAEVKLPIKRQGQRENNNSEHIFSIR